jgi:hypothetical protein
MSCARPDRPRGRGMSAEIIRLLQTSAGREELRKVLRSPGDWYALGLDEILSIGWDLYAQYGAEIERELERDREIKQAIERESKERGGRS